MINNHDIIIMVFVYIILANDSFIAGIGFGCHRVAEKSDKHWTTA